MKARQFNTSLKTAGISQRKFALYFGFDVSTVNRWARGRADIPQYAERIVKILADNPKLVAAYAMNAIKEAA